MANQKFVVSDSIDSLRTSLGSIVGSCLRDEDYARAQEVVAHAKVGYFATLARLSDQGEIDASEFFEAKQRALSGPIAEMSALIKRAMDFDSDARYANRDNHFYGV